MNTVLCVSGHPEDLADGRVIGHGETAPNVDLDLPANRALLDEGRISVVAEPKPAPKQRRKPAKPDEGDTQ